MANRYFVLWDIDQTLVDGADLGPRIWGGAFERLTGLPVSTSFDPHGSTDTLIFRALAQLHEVDDLRWTDAQIAAAYDDAFHAVEADWNVRARPKPAALETTVALAGRGVVQSVLTGNVAANARGKLEALGLHANLDFGLGAYGDDPHRVRGDLVAVALRRAHDAGGHEFRAAETVLVGDTPLDVEAGRVGGARVIGVATGSYSVAELTAAGADHVVAELSELPAVVDAVATG